MMIPFARPQCCVDAATAHRKARRCAGVTLTLLLALSLTGLDPCLARGPEAEADADQSVTAAVTDLPARVSFNQHIRPLFIQHCTECHGGVKQAADLSFVYRDDTLNVLEPGEPENSYILDRISAETPEERMPPPEHGPGLTNAEIELFRKWIRQGAVWEDHWAYQRPRRHAPPAVSRTDWCRTSIDPFVLARLDQQQLEPADDEMPHRWLRRVSLDLTGLPPTLAERDAFLDDLARRGEGAYAAVVDRLLDSPRYGERWASVWLDQVRYADSKGLGQDGRRTIWKYRDWVIAALNADMPYDDFTIKQIAGDLLPNPTIGDRLATAAHRLTQTNEEGGTDDEEFRIAAVLDRVNTVWQTWQGTTFGCVQCHHHPYDPFRNSEYYEFAAFFNNTADSDLNEDWPVLPVPNSPDDYSEASQLDNQIAALKQQIWKRRFEIVSDTSLWQPVQELQASSSTATQVRVEPHEPYAQYRTVGTVTQNTDFTLQAALPDTLEQLTAVRLTALPLHPETAEADSEWGFVLSHVQLQLLRPDSEEPEPLNVAQIIGDEPDPDYDPNASLDPKSPRGFAAYSRIHYPRQAVLILAEPIAVTPETRLQITLKHRVMLLGAFPLIIRRGQFAVSGNASLTDLLDDRQLIEQQGRLAALEKQRRQIPSTSTPVLAERPAHLARPQHVFERGLFLTKGERVTPDVPESLPPLPADLPRNRLALARWLVSDQNPLTARVAVNRAWSRLFGVGLVATEEDFGSTGEPPSHPKLLDDLAVRFREDFGWSQKRLLREIVLSRTYRQSSRLRPDLAERDPQNRLLARGPRGTLPAEMIRDQALALSGLLSDTMYGPPVHPPIPDGVWQPFQAGDKWNTPQPGQLDRYRRSIYTYVKRSIPYPMFATFDAPTREFCTPRRLRSNTPLQPLMTLNDTVFVECARALAERMQNDTTEAPEQIEHGFLIVTCREPRKDELAALQALYDEVRAERDLDAALATVASVLLNLDEVLTK